METLFVTLRKSSEAFDKLVPAWCGGEVAAEASEAFISQDVIHSCSSIRVTTGLQPQERTLRAFMNGFSLIQNAVIPVLAYAVRERRPPFSAWCCSCSDWNSAISYLGPNQIALRPPIWSCRATNKSCRHHVHHLLLPPPIHLFLLPPIPTNPEFCDLH